MMKLAKNEGKKFEEDFKRSVPEWCWCNRYKDGTANFKGDKNENVRFQAHNICDFEVFAKDKLFLLELKSYQGASIPLSGIRKNQLEGMIKASRYKNVIPYFLLNFRGVQRVYAIKVQTLHEFIKTTTRKSIPIKFCVENGIEIASEQKRTRFRYNLEILFSEQIEESEVKESKGWKYKELKLGV
ncbi:hypothetical protein Z957_02055 [Clostridium sp. K25]|nr:hypothetical protein Z957_02055 [Clostridium sp. K25]